MKPAAFIEVLFRLSLGAALALTAGCSGSGSASSARPPLSASSTTNVHGFPPGALTADVVRSLPRVSLAGIPAAVRITAPDVRTSNASALSGRRGALSVAGANDAEVLGTVMFGGGNYTGVYAQHSAYSATSFPLNYPTGATGSQELFAPLTLPTNGGCLSSGTVALNTGGGNYTFFVVFDYCGAGAPKLVAGAQIDDPRDTTHFFKNNYVFTNPHGLPVYATLNFTPDAVPSAKSTWYVLLYNTKSNSYNVVFQETGLSNTTYGYSVFESTYLPGACPSGLPPIGADYLMLYSASTGAFEPVAPTMKSTTSVAIGASAATPCFNADAAGRGTHAFAINTPNSSWTVTTLLTTDPSGFTVTGDPPLAKYAALDAQFKTFMQTNGIRSGQLAIGKAGQVLYSHAYTNSKDPAYSVTQPTSIMRLESNSKAIETAAITKLFASGAVTPSTLVFPFLGVSKPLLATQTPDPRINTITVQQLIDHTGGFHDSTGSAPEFNMWQIETAAGNTGPLTQAQFTQYLYGAPLQNAPGTYAYSNDGYYLLARVIEKAAGQPYFEWVTANVLTPVGITDAVITATDASGRRPNETVYDDPATGRSVLTPQQNVILPVQYGGSIVFEVTDGPISVAESASSLVKFAGNYNVYGLGPRQAGVVRIGSLFGSTSLNESLGNGMDFAFIFNTRLNQSGVKFDLTPLQTYLEQNVVP